MKYSFQRLKGSLICFFTPHYFCKTNDTIEKSGWSELSHDTEVFRRISLCTHHTHFLFPIFVWVDLLFKLLGKRKNWKL